MFMGRGERKDEEKHFTIDMRGVCWNARGNFGKAGGKPVVARRDRDFIGRESGCLCSTAVTVHSAS